MKSRIRILSLAYALMATFCALAVLTACGTSPTPAQIVAQANAVASGLQGAITQIAKADPNLIPATTLAQINGYLSDAQSAASQLSATMPASTGALTAQQVEGDINAVLNVLAGPPINGLIPAPANQAIAAAAIIVPSLEAFVNTYLPTASATPGTIFARAKLQSSAPQITTTAQALAVLQKYAH